MARQEKKGSRSKSNQLNRREFVALPALIPLMKLQYQDASTPAGGLTDVAGITVGHYTDSRRPTGCTAVLLGAGAAAGVDVRGSAPGTRETDLLDPVKSIQKVHAILLSGGSSFGLESATGAVRYLEEKGIGYQSSAGVVPIVPAAIIFDLGIGEGSVRPDATAGYKACESAGNGAVQEGCVGAGSGATVGKLTGRERAMKSGLGTASLKVGDLVVAALAVVNCVGDVIDPENGRIVAGARKQDGSGFADTMQLLIDGKVADRSRAGENTTLVVVATNADLDKTELTKIAQMSHDGMARAINPVHLPSDGDTAFAVATARIGPAPLTQVGALAAEVTSRAIVRGVVTATGIEGLPAARDLG